MNSDTPFTTIGDEAVEARIVAWVLGEASAFEAAELERLCAERPELMIFKRRMTALHDLLAEAENPQADEAWKLPPEKRKAQEFMQWKNSVADIEQAREKRVKRNGRRTLLAIAACLLILAILAGLASPMMMRQRKKSDIATLRSAEMQELLALADAEPRMRSLRTELPAELIEGTPQPMNVPNLERPADGPAGSETWRRSAFTQRAGDPAANEGAAPAPARPAAPASSMARVAASSAQSARAPEEAGEMPALATLDALATGAAPSDGFANGTTHSGARSPGQAGGPVGRDFTLSGEALADADGDSDKSGIAAAGGAVRIGRELQAGYSSEYAFRGVAQEQLSESALLPSLGGLPAVGGLFSEADASESVTRAEEMRRTGRYDEARQELHRVLEENPADRQAGDALARLDDPLRTNPALTDEHTRNVDEVRRGLYMAEGNFNLGKFDDAKREYENVLRKDPYNSAARRGMERIAAAESDYYRAAYDQTRSELLSQVDNAWELAVPAEEGTFEGFIDLGSPILGDDTASLAKAIREQEDKVEERRKVLATIVRTKGIIHEGRDSAVTRGEAIQRGLDAQDYVDARREFEREQELLQQMRLKLIAATISEKPESPEPDLTRLMDEVAASEEPYSTFSLNISDASFRIALAALEKGGQPDPAGIKVEQFYNAVDYGDPAPAAGEPVSCAIEQAAHPVIPGRNLVRIALRTAAAGRSEAQPLRLTLLVDQSGSMTRADRRAAMEHAIAGLESLLTEKDKVSVIGFSRTPRLLADGVRGDEARLNDMIHQTAATGGTNLEQAILLAEELATRHLDAGAQNRIVLFTDGAVNLGDAEPTGLAERVQRLRQRGIAFDIAGIAADDLNDALLGELARHGNGRYHVMGKGGDEDFAAKLAGAFRPAAENVKVQVRFNPERVARYRLVGFEQDRLRTEDFRNDAVDAAELAAEEAGVAIYQIEPLPDGRGEIGEVSVRFRDTAAGEMVERMWTIPHDDAAPALDRAAPSMQLAVLAMLAAEKLRGGPLGEAIDFTQLAEPQADVRRHFAGDARVADLLRMVGMLK